MKIKTVLSIGAAFILLAALTYASNNIIAQDGKLITEGIVGVGTATPEIVASYNGSLSGSMTVNIFQNDSGKEASLIVQGNGGSVINLIDLGGALDNKWLLLKSDNSLGAFHSVNDNATAYVTQNILTMNMASGNIGIGTSNSDHDLEIGTGTYSEIDAGESTFATGSSREIKKDIKDINIEESAEKILQLKPVSYKWDNDKLEELYENVTFDNEETQYGLIAEDTQEIYTDMEEGKVEWHMIYVDLIATVQYLQSELCEKDNSYGFC